MTAAPPGLKLVSVCYYRRRSVRRQNLLDKLAMELREDLVHLS